MQYSYIQNLLKRPSAQAVQKIAKVVFLCFLLGYLYNKLEQDQNFNQDFLLHFVNLFREPSAWGLLLPLILMPFNWGLEAFKWQVVMKKVYPLTFRQAFEGVLAGLSVGLVSHRVAGSAIGRMGFLPVGFRKKSLGPMVVSQLGQTFATYFGGSIGLIYFFKQQGVIHSLFWDVLPFCLLLAMAVVFYMLKNFSGSVARKKYVGFLKDSTEALSMYSNREFLKVLILAVGRYLVFTFQTIWVFKLVGIDLGLFTLFVGTACVFLSKTVLPSFGLLAELGVRSGAALFFFTAFGVDESLITFGSLLIWFLNVLIPALTGGAFIWRKKIHLKEKAPAIS